MFVPINLIKFFSILFSEYRIIPFIIHRSILASQRAKFGRPFTPTSKPNSKYPILHGYFWFDYSWQGLQYGNQTFDPEDSEWKFDVGEIRELLDDVEVKPP